MLEQSNIDISTWYNPMFFWVYINKQAFFYQKEYEYPDIFCEN